MGLIERIRGGNPVDVFATEHGLLVTGGSEEVSSFIDGLLAEIEATQAVRSPTDDEPAGPSVLHPLARPKSEYVEFSSHAMAYIKQRKLVPAVAGHFRSFVVKKGDSAGSIDWKTLDLSPAKVVAFQGVAVRVAMKLAIREVTDAIERVEGKVDKLLQLARSERLGTVNADRKSLERIAERAAQTATVSKSDWSTVAHLGAGILQGIESFREYIAREAANSERSVFVRARNAELEDLTNELLRESLALLVAAEHNYLLWQRIRVAHVKTNERDAYADTVADAHAALTELTAADQNLIDSIHHATLELIRPSGWEGLAPLKRKKMYELGEAIERELAWFACQRHLDAPEIEAVFPKLRQSIDHALSKLMRHAAQTDTTSPNVPIDPAVPPPPPPPTALDRRQ